MKLIDQIQKLIELYQPEFIVITSRTFNNQFVLDKITEQLINHKELNKELKLINDNSINHNPIDYLENLDDDYINIIISHNPLFINLAKSVILLEKSEDGTNQLITESQGNYWYGLGLDIISKDLLKLVRTEPKEIETLLNEFYKIYKVRGVSEEVTNRMIEIRNELRTINVNLPELSRVERCLIL